MTARERADRLLVARGLFESRARAQAAIAAGLVTADGVPVRKASDAISVAAAIEAAPAHPYVSRGGVKLAAALDHFQLDVDRPHLPRRRRLDRRLHRSACCARRPARLRDRRRQRPASLRAARPQRDRLDGENRHPQRSTPARLAEPPDFAVVDVSFISLKLVLPAIGKLLQPRAHVVALIKPQFEAQRRDVKKGIVRDAAITRGLRRIAAFLTSLGWRVGGVMPSPILGGDGNREFLIEAERG